MLYTFMVASKSNTGLMVAVEGSGLDKITAQRSAIQFARARHGIPDPIVLTERQQAERTRRWVAEHILRLMQSAPLNGTGMPFWMAPITNKYYN